MWKQNLAGVDALIKTICAYLYYYCISYCCMFLKQWTGFIERAYDYYSHVIIYCVPGMAQGVLPEGQHRHGFDGTLQNGQSQRKLSGFTAHLNCFDPIGPTKQVKNHFFPPTLDSSSGLNIFVPNKEQIT